LSGDQKDPNLDLCAGYYLPSMAIGDPHPGKLSTPTRNPIGRFSTYLYEPPSLGGGAGRNVSVMDGPSDRLMVTVKAESASANGVKRKFVG
jgi:hypothetical protein